MGLHSQSMAMVDILCVLAIYNFLTHNIKMTTRQRLDTSATPVFPSVIAGGVTVPTDFTRTFTENIPSTLSWWSTSTSSILDRLWGHLDLPTSTIVTNSSELALSSGWINVGNDTGTYLAMIWVDIGDAETFAGSEVRLRLQSDTTLTPDPGTGESTWMDISTNTPQRFTHVGILRFSANAHFRGQIQHDHGSTLTIDGHGGILIRIGDT